MTRHGGGTFEMPDGYYCNTCGLLWDETEKCPGPPVFEGAVCWRVVEDVLESIVDRREPIFNRATIQRAFENLAAWRDSTARRYNLIFKDRSYPEIFE